MRKTFWSLVVLGTVLSLGMAQAVMAEQPAATAHVKKAKKHKKPSKAAPTGTTAPSAPKL